MMWLKRIFSQVDDRLVRYLKSLGVSDDVINMLSYYNKEHEKKYLLDYIRKNPHSTIEQLREVDIPEYKSPYTNIEHQIANQFADTNFKKWVLVQLRSNRNKISVENNNVIFRTNESAMSLIHVFQHVYDWYIQVQPDISSYDIVRASRASEAWSSNLSNQGKELSYDKTNPSAIVYGPSWKNPKFNGWTIQKVLSNNDLLVEGHKMNCCVGSYCKQVEDSVTQILSLRDPDNEPHVTIERHPDGEMIDQVKGYGNSVPKKLYVEMIKEWISDDDVFIAEDGIPYINIESGNFQSLEEINNELTNQILEPNMFGMIRDLTHVDFEIILNNILDFLQNVHYKTKILTDTLDTESIRTIDTLKKCCEACDIQLMTDKKQLKTISANIISFSMDIKEYIMKMTASEQLIKSCEYILRTEKHKQINIFVAAVRSEIENMINSKKFTQLLNQAISYMQSIIQSHKAK